MNGEPERNRLFTIICIAVGVQLLPILAVAVVLLAGGWATADILLALLILLVTAGTATISVLCKAYGLTMGEKGIFHSSGNPPKMAEALYQSLHTESQTLILILVVGLISTLLVVKAIEAGVGVPVIGTAAGVALGRQFLTGQDHRGDSDKRQSGPN